MPDANRHHFSAQFPITLAWALNVHSAQGLSLGRRSCTSRSLNADAHCLHSAIIASVVQPRYHDMGLATFAQNLSPDGVCSVKRLYVPATLLFTSGSTLYLTVPLVTGVDQTCKLARKLLDLRTDCSARMSPCNVLAAKACLVPADPEQCTQLDTLNAFASSL